MDDTVNTKRLPFTRKLLSTKNILLTTGLLANILLIGYLFYVCQYLKVVNNHLNNQLVTNSNTVNEVQTTHSISDYRLIPSPSGRFILSLIPVSDVSVGYAKCTIDIFDNFGDSPWNIDLKKLLGFEYFNCLNGMYGLYTDELIGWNNDNTLAFQRGGTIYQVTIIDPKDEKNGIKITTYSYDEKKLRVLEPNNNKDTYLFVETEEAADEDKLVLIDLSTNKTIKELVYQKGALDTPLYDHVNNGYVYSQRFFSDNSVLTKIYFLRMSDYIVKTLLSEENEFFGGRGCGPIRLRSVKSGEIILDHGNCLTISAEKHSPDGYLHLKI